MTKKLTLVVTCTERKSVQPTERLRIRNLLHGTVEERAACWRHTLHEADERTPLRELYQGDAWTQALRLETTARRAGFEPSLLVASAGLGLVSADTKWPAYAATFSPRHADSISNYSDGIKAWWHLMTKDQETLQQQLNGPTVFVLSGPYATAMSADFAHLEDRDDVVVFGGSKHVPNRIRIPADRSLMNTLGGTATSLNLRTAITWLEHLDAPKIAGARHSKAWNEWAERSRMPEPPKRIPLSDEEVFNFVRTLRQTHPDISKSRALRALRDSGLACEQKRFGELFNQVPVEMA